MIIHIDMDAFYASVEERERPELVGQPVVVGGSSESRSVVSAANYKAREFGIHSAMPMSRAVRLCPGLVRLPVRMDLYAAVSEQIQAVFGRYTPQIEPLALDEAFLDVRASEQLYGSAEVIARRIKDEILQELQLVASVGVAPNKFLAKLASDIDKPDGFVVIRADQVQAFLDPLPVSRL
ncbi:MAG: DNA polymerase IV, partial [Gammaproteobacteria bacterium]|nr:DNA polymerase IV [Gammaproteobacteria bacterium]